MVSSWLHIVVQHCTGVLQLLVLPAPQLAAVTSFVSRLGWNFNYEATLTQLAGQHCRHETVYVYLTDKQIIVREFYLRLIPHRLVSYRVHPQLQCQDDLPFLGGYSGGCLIQNIREASGTKTTTTSCLWEPTIRFVKKQERWD